MQKDSAHNIYKLRNAYDTDLAIIPEIVDSAVAHFLMKQLWKPMNLEIRIVPEIRNRRKMTLIMGDKNAINIEENKYLKPCVCKRQLAEEIQKLRIHMAFDEIRKCWHEIYSGNTNSKWPYENNEAIQPPTYNTISSTSTARPIISDNQSRRMTFSCLSIQSFLNSIRSTSSSNSTH